MRPILLILPLLALSSACSERSYDEEEPSVDSPGAIDGPARRETGRPPPQPVRIGEGGPRFDACQAVGRVQGRATLDVLAAPFDDAEPTDQIGEGQRVWICTRSIDQQWFGVVYDRTEEGPGDCGVAAPVRSKRNYDGPCRSGWIESTFVKLIAG